ncbi:Dipeptide-binding ABC transporter, periplasmic substrate-binding component (TC 3.A.1.5.2), partial [hydrothermal vent metagenome]
MKNTRKWTTLIALFLALSFFIVACGGGDATDEEPAADDATTTEDAGDEAMDDEEMEAMDDEEMEAMDDEEMEAMDDEEMEAMDDEEMMEFEPTSVAAENCDYGGKISSIEAVDELTVVFNLCKPDPAFLAKIAFTPFGIQPAEWLAETGGTGQLLEQPIGTGPYMVQEWVRGDSVIYQRFDDYWGDAAFAETAVLRWNQEGAARLVELQAGTVDMITNVSPDDFATVEADPNLVLLPNASPNVLYLAMTNTFEPFDNQMVRQAIAMGIDRQRIVDNFFPAGSEVASHFTPCSIPGGCEGDSWY